MAIIPYDSILKIRGSIPKMLFGPYVVPLNYILQFVPSAIAADQGFELLRKMNR